MLKLAYGDAAVTTKTVYKWFERFRNGCESVEDERSGRPSTSKTQKNVERVSDMIRPNRRLTIRKISEHLNISYVRRKPPEKWANGFILHHYNAPCHISFLVRQFLSNKNITVSSSTLFTGSGTVRLLALPQSQNKTMIGKRFESIQDIEATKKCNERHSRKRNSRTSSESGKNDGISMFEARGSILRGINDNVSFSVIVFLFKHSPYFFDNSGMYILHSYYDNRI